MPEYTEKHAQAGIGAQLPAIETWPNQFKGYRIKIEIPEFTSVCPKTGMPDFGKLTIEYEPDALCLELKSLKLYMLAYRDLGIFYENVVNRVLKDIVETIRPVWATVEGKFTPRGGLNSTVTAEYNRESGGIGAGFRPGKSR
jgi:7-cyano-7-deazaguanine reductase